jgi:DNA-binding CsgD family transcriptional regulator
VQRAVAVKGAIWDTDDIFRQEGAVMRYLQITPDERYRLAALRTQHPPLSNAEIARQLGRHPSTVARELRRNAARHDGAYRPSKAQERTNGRRSRTRRGSTFTARQWMFVEGLLVEGWSPEQISGRLRRDGILRISYERPSTSTSGRTSTPADRCISACGSARRSIGSDMPRPSGADV